MSVTINNQKKGISMFNVSTMSPEVARVFRRTQHGKQFAKQIIFDSQTHARALWESGMNLLNEILNEKSVADEIEAIRSRPSAEDNSQTEPKEKLIEKEFAEMEKPAKIKMEKPALPVGLALPEDKIADPQAAAALLGVDVDELD